jgi:hypothetical protein
MHRSTSNGRIVFSNASICTAENVPPIPSETNTDEPSKIKIGAAKRMRKNELNKT